MDQLSRVPTMTQLQALTTAAAMGSLSAAGHRLGITQQAVSGRVAAAERVLGVAVFERSPTGVSLTPAGSVVVAWARGVLDAAMVLDDGVSALRGSGRTLLSVSASNTVSEHLLPQWSRTLRARHPELQLRIRPGNSAAVIADVARAEVALGFVEGPQVPRTLRSRTLLRDELVVVVPLEHRWAGRTELTVAELEQEAFVLREEGSGTRQLFERHVRMTVPAAMVLSTAAAVRDAALALGAPTVMSSLSLHREVPHRFVPVAVAGLAMRRRIRAVWHPQQPPRGLAADLLSVAASGARKRPRA